MKQAELDFDRLVGEFFSVWCRYHPHKLVATEVRSANRRFPPVDDDEVAALLAWLETTLVGLEEIPFSQLNMTRRIELQMLFGACQLEYTAMLARDWRRNDPVAWVRAAEMCLEDSAALPELPEFLRGARGHLVEMPETIPPLWLEQGERLALALAQRIHDRLVEVDDIDESLSGARHAVLEYAACLSEQHFAASRGSAAVGPGYYARVMRLGYHLGEDLECLDAVLGERQLMLPDGLQIPREEALQESDTGIRHFFECRATRDAWQLYLAWLGGEEEPAIGSCRVLARVDLDFHLARVGEQDALQRLTTLAKDGVDASSRLLDISHSPGRWLATWIYYRMLQGMVVQHCAGDKACVQRFHLQLRELGPVPLPLVPLRLQDNPSDEGNWMRLVSERCGGTAVES